MKLKLDDEVLRALELRNEMNRKRPDFIRQEAHRFKRLGEKWRAPRGPRSKLRLKKKGKPAVVEAGYRGPRLARGLHPCGGKEVIIHNLKELEGLDPSVHVIRIAASVGKKKRLEIIKKALSLNFKIVNLRLDEKELLQKELLQGGS
ncbi:MAG: 50S ribosomal protein L32e [Candidatus Verstraetearchaeota archaeon]|jgi:large subunit ribosomal protein L32e|nr:50S ribosomal protein L32e [Candidatus Verstraetearchaeota archaeon]